MFTKDCPAIIIEYPSGKFGFVGMVHEALCNRSFATVEDAKVAAVDVMIETRESFRVDISVSEEAAAIAA